MPRFAHYVSMGRAFGVAAAVLVAAVPTMVGPVAEISPTIRDYQPTGTSLIMGGTGVPLSIPPDTPDLIGSEVNSTYSDFIETSGLCVGGNVGCRLAAVYTPEQLWPLLGTMPFGQSVAVGQQLLHNCLTGAECITTEFPYTTTGPTTMTDSNYVVVGESQSSVISTYEKRYLIAHPIAGTSVSFILISNQNRPNGGILQRFVGSYIPVLDIVFDGATPTGSPQPTPLTTVDIATQYDGWADFPTNPLNLLADLNAVVGMLLLHSTFRSFVGEPQLQGQYQDTTYYLQTPSVVPLLLPLTQIPLIGRPLADALDPFVRVLIETAYDRTVNPGAPTPANYLYFPDPVKTLINLAVAIPTGLDNAIADITGDLANRPFGTSPAPPFGVGGPPVDVGAIDPYGPPTPIMPTEEFPTASKSVATLARQVIAENTPTTAAPRAAMQSRRAVRVAKKPTLIADAAPSSSAKVRGVNGSRHELRNRSSAK